MGKGLVLLFSIIIGGYLYPNINRFYECQVRIGWLDRIDIYQQIPFEKDIESGIQSLRKTFCELNPRIQEHLLGGQIGFIIGLMWIFLYQK